MSNGLCSSSIVAHGERSLRNCIGILRATPNGSSSPALWGASYARADTQIAGERTTRIGGPTHSLEDGRAR